MSHLVIPFPGSHPRTRRRFPERRRSSAVIEERTGPLELLRGRAVLLLLDEENIRFGARDLGRKASFRRLREQVQAHAASSVCHAFLTTNEDNNARVKYLAARGYQVHVQRADQHPDSHAGRPTNADPFMLFHSGVIVSRSTATAVIIATGDGGLALSLAQSIRSLPKRRAILTLSLPGSTAQRLDARRTALVDHNLEIGSDCLRPL
jgi:hypothetical protein